MKRLSEERTTTFFEKLSKYIGGNIRLLIERSDDKWCFREHKDRVFYGTERLFKLAESHPADKVSCVGTCFGKFTKSNKFRLAITALHFIAPYAERKIWVKSSMEQQFLYGHNVTKSGLGRISENVEQFDGVVVFSMNDMPLGFGVAGRSTANCKNADPLAVVLYHQADIGEYARNEDFLI